jgi:cell division protein ZapA
MGEVAIKIAIGNREYPLRVQEESVQVLEEISKKLNESIDNYRKNLGLSDVQDAIAMTAFDCMVKQHAAEKYNSNPSDGSVIESIAELNQKIDKALS